MKKLFVIAVLISANAVAQLITAPVAPPALTTPKAQAKATVQIKIGAQQVYNFMLARTQALAAIVWDNDDGLTPQQVFTGLGVNQCDAHQKFLGAAQFLNAIIAGSIPAEPKTVTEAGSGSACVVTVAP